MPRRGAQMEVGYRLVKRQQRPHHLLGLLRGEEPVAAQRDDQHWRLDGLEGLLERTILLAQIILVHGPRDVQVGVGVEAVDELARRQSLRAG